MLDDGLVVIVRMAMPLHNSDDHGADGGNGLYIQTLAIDVSIWLTQFIKAMRDDEGKTIKNAHLIGTLRRIIKVSGSDVIAVSRKLVIPLM